MSIGLRGEESEEGGRAPRRRVEKGGVGGGNATPFHPEALSKNPAEPGNK